MSGGGYHPPASVILSWPTPNYVNPETRGYFGLVACAVIGTVAVATVAARMYARVFVLRSFGMDDWLLLAAVLPTAGMIICICLAINVYDFGRHIWDVPPEIRPTQQKLELIGEVFYIWASSLIRLSILFFYRRLTSSAVTNTYHIIVWAGIVIMSMQVVAFTLSICLTCRPFVSYWMQFDDAWVASGNRFHCISLARETLAINVIGAVQDFLLALLPLTLFWKLQISRRQKIILMAIFGAGFFVCAAGIVRSYYVHVIFWQSYDTTWETYEWVAWSAVETLGGMICASLPALKVFFKRDAQDTQYDNRHSVADTVNFRSTNAQRKSMPRSRARSDVGSSMSLDMTYFNDLGNDNESPVVVGKSSVETVMGADNDTSSLKHNDHDALEDESGGTSLYL